MVDISSAEKIEELRLREVSLAHAIAMHPSVIPDETKDPAAIVAAAGEFFTFLNVGPTA